MKELQVELNQMSISEFYDEVARKLGYTNTDDLNYDCTKIDVSNKIQDMIFGYYYDKGIDKDEIAMIWVCYGPKAHYDWNDWKVQVEDGFVEEV